jgi:glucoamylase
MRRRILSSVLAVALVGAGAAGSATQSAATPAESAASKKSAKPKWDEADKTGFGTARERRSRVWFTLQSGRVSEVFYPDLSTPSLRALELEVRSGSTTDRQGTDMTTVVTRPDERSLRFTLVSTDNDGRYRITEQVVTDPARSAVAIQVRLESLDGAAYQLGVRVDPSLANGGTDDRGRSKQRALVAVDGKEKVAIALTTTPALRATKDRYLGGRNLVQTGTVSGVTGLAGAQDATLRLGFGGTTGKAKKASRSPRTWSDTATTYDAGWHRYLNRLNPVPATASAIQREYLASALVLAAGEDKANRGALIASPSAPWVWGDEVKDLSSPSAPYHAVWSRDVYQFGTALWAMGDKAAARRAVTWLFRTQQKPDGSFPQNSDVRGKPVWGELQLDEVALPIALAHLVGKTDKRTYRGVKKAVRFLLTFRDEETGRRAPFSPQERWENQSGYSPNTIAALIDGLVTGAAIARDHGDRALARQWLRTADRWKARTKKLTATRTGPLSDAPYFLRVTKDGKPNKGTKYSIGDGGPERADQRRVVDPSFLDLVRFGILAPNDPVVLNTLSVVDADLGVMTPNGTFWHRFSFDGYGETATGGQWEITEPGTRSTLGRAWPLLTGERGEYAVAAGADGAPYLAAMAAAAGGSDMIAEQVWDGRPPTGQACCPAGEGTRSATPLLWSHAGLVRLAWTMQQGRPVDQQAVVARRYVG